MLFTDIIISADVEANGPIPGPHSMWSLGSGAFTIEKDGCEYKPKLIDQFSVNLEDLPGAVPDKGTMEWWRDYPDALRTARENPQPPKLAMQSYVDWLSRLGKNVVFAAWPATYDFMFVYWYLMRFVGNSPFLHSGLDMRSYAMCLKKSQSWTRFSKSNTPLGWSPPNENQHVAISDAIQQGYLACNMLIENLR